MCLCGPVAEVVLGALSPMSRSPDFSITASARTGLCQQLQGRRMLLLLPPPPLGPQVLGNRLISPSASRGRRGSWQGAWAGLLKGHFAKQLALQLHAPHGQWEEVDLCGQRGHCRGVLAKLGPQHHVHFLQTSL